MKNIKKTVLLILVPVVIVITVGLIYKFRVPIADFLNPESESESVSDSDDGPKVIDIVYLNKKLEKIAELRTGKVSYGCLAVFGEGDIPLIDKKSVKVYYEAEAYAGIDVSRISSEQDKNGKFIIQLPASSVYDKEIVITRKDYLEQEKAVFNWTKLGDGDEMDNKLKENFKNQPIYYELMKMADENAVSVIKNLLLGFLDEEQFEIKIGEREIKPLASLPFSSDDGLKKNFDEVVKELENAGFINIKKNAVDKKKYDVFAKDGKVEKITVDGREVYMKNDTFVSDVEVIITYQRKS